MLKIKIKIKIKINNVYLAFGTYDNKTMKEVVRVFQKRKLLKKN